MSNDDQLKSEFWSALKSDRTLMLGLSDVEHGFARPMTAQFEEEGGPIWFFTSKDTDLAKALSKGQPEKAFGAFSSKGHALFTAIEGELQIDNDRAVIDRLWNSFVAAWFEGGKDDPKLTLLRFDAKQAEIWADASSLIAGVKIVLGFDPKEQYKDKVAKVRL